MAATAPESFDSILDAIIIIASEYSDLPATSGSSLVTELGLDSLDISLMGIAIESRFPQAGDIDIDPQLETVSDVARFVEKRIRMQEVPKQEGVQ